VKVFQGATDPNGAPHRFLNAQRETARDAAQAHGYRNVSRSLVPDKDHGPLADEVLGFFFSLLTTGGAGPRSSP
jgi:hypothetical protein